MFNFCAAQGHRRAAPLHGRNVSPDITSLALERRLLTHSSRKTWCLLFGTYLHCGKVWERHSKRHCDHQFITSTKQRPSLRRGPLRDGLSALSYECIRVYAKRFLLCSSCRPKKRWKIHLRSILHLLISVRASSARALFLHACASCTLSCSNSKFLQCAFPPA